MDTTKSTNYKSLSMPIRVPVGCKLDITQKYGNTSNNAWYLANGITSPSHNGTDVVLLDINGNESAKLTYGSSVITPSEDWQIVKVTFDSPMSTKGNGITLESPEFMENGLRKKCQIVIWHCSEVLSTSGKLPKGTTVAYLGNSGLVSPAPTVFNVYAGSHAHLMLFNYFYSNGWCLENNSNGMNGAVDFMTRFDITNLIYGPDTSVEKDLPPFLYFIQKVSEMIKNLFH